MKICLFGDATSPHLDRLGRALSERGVHVRLITHKVADIPGVSVEKFAVPPPALGNLRGWDARRRRYLRDIFRHADLVNLHFLHDWQLEPELVGGGAFIASPWGSDIVPPPGEDPPDQALHATRVDMLQRAAGISVVGHNLARDVASYAEIDARRIDVIPWGVDMTMFKPAARTGDRILRVGFFKGFRPVYGAEHLVRAIALLAKTHPHVRFDFVGDGATKATCECLAHRHHVGSMINWHAARPLHDMPALMQTWDMVVIPSRKEAFGMAALESSAMGLPVVASDVSGLRETVRDGVTGVLTPPEDADALAQAIATLADSPALRHEMGSAGRDYVARHFERESCLNAQMAFFQRVLQGRLAPVG